MRKLLTLALFGIVATLSHRSFADIVGPPGGCVGSTYWFVDSTSSTTGVWSSSNPSVATISSSGVVTAVSAGSAIISFVDGSAVYTSPFTVSPVPAAIAGPSSICVGSTATFTDATTGGTWSTGSSYYATIDPATGVATGVHSGIVNIYYEAGAGCYATTSVTISGAPGVDSILGGHIVCVGSTITLTDATSGGVWSSSNPSVATVSGGVVSGVASGSAIISYAVTGTCGTTIRTHVVTVTSTTSPGAITGTAVVMAGSTTWLYDATSGGTWSSSSPSIATVSSSGMVTGVAAGTCTISYAVSGCSGTAYATRVVTVNAFDGISGHVLFGGTSYYGPVKVWLIKFNPSTSMLTACDSTTVYSSGSSAFYQFIGVATDSFRVKAATEDSIFTTSGYVPTYHTSSFYWSTATVIPHVSGTSDINKDINMAAGTATTGPGFIAGDVTMGANKGTSGSIPSVNLLMYVEDNATGVVMQQTYTDAAGHYSFSNLPVGTYRIYPELINYGTTPYVAINLTASAPSMTAASFEQHTISHTITPIGTAIVNASEPVSYISSFPNPTSGKVNVSWNAIANEQAAVTVTDVTGRQVYSTVVNMNKGAGATSIDLSGLNSGLYMISMKSESVNYNNKIQIIK